MITWGPAQRTAFTGRASGAAPGPSAGRTTTTSHSPTTAPLPGSTFSRPAQHTLAPYARLNLGLRGETTVRGVTMEAQMRLVNVFDRRNTFDQSLAPARPRAAPTTVPRTLPGRRAFVLLGIRY